MLIPILQGRRIISWQARTFDPDAKKFKYLFPPKCKKSTYLYNMDNALFTENCVLVEGVTDVWRVGPGGSQGESQAVALFGKSMSTRQEWMMKHLWGYDGSCVILLDPDAELVMRKLCARLRKNEIFPKGVPYLVLAKGYDPAMYGRPELLELIRQARTKCTNDPLEE